MSTSETLRERRRRETRTEIHATALRLAREHGFDGITVEMIAIGAGVSPRTFFNYFPSKEEAVVHGPTALPQAFVDDFAALGPARPGVVLDDLTRLLVRDLAETRPGREEFRTVFRLAHEHTAVQAALLTRFDRFQRSVAEAVALRLGKEPGDEVPSLIAALGLAAVRVGLERWAADDSPERDESALPYVERSLTLLRTFLTA
ncbi:acyl-CoA-like ligand-binding transcription factor [Streptomyces paludis]|uniref:TetR family transcriptional regulator n=1 Tax=Streptomyces paludis TaxID=2282738 RepID=A0A345HZR8_9ACTN|nr:TetR family transcriptional regulator [Streptomyces paludis]AXG82192.1 TetR family transcriptional regulator [Streptomyces paludis]